MHNQTSLRGLGRNHFNLSILECGAKSVAKMKTKKLLRQQFFIHQQEAFSGKTGNTILLHLIYLKI
jgi:hypothetical protein